MNELPHARGVPPTSGFKPFDRLKGGKHGREPIKDGDRSYRLLGDRPTVRLPPSPAPRLTGGLGLA